MIVSWLKRYMELSKGTEIPDMFALWCGLSGISAALGRNVYVDMGTYTIYPNMFVVLVAGSGKCRKSTSIGQVEMLLAKMTPRPNIIAQKITPEALIVALKHTKGDKVLCEVSEGFVVVDELSTFLNKKTYEMGLASLMISMYDCKDDFAYHTRGRGVERVENCCLGLLGGSTIEWIKEAIPADAIGGGLTSRILFIYVKVPPPPIAWTSTNPEHEALKLELIHGLNRMVNSQGEMVFSPEARGFYEKTYNEFYNNSSFFHNRYLGGYASRRHVHMIKLGMLFSIAEGDKLVIEGSHLDKALELLITAEGNMVEVLALITATDSGSKVEMIRSYIKSKGDLDRSLLQRHFQRQMNWKELDLVIQTLIQSGQIVARTDGQKCVFHYRG